MTKKDLINEKFDCDIIINSIKFSNSIRLQKENNIIYNFKNKYTDLSDMFHDCELLTSVNLSNFNTNGVTNMSLCSVAVLL